jgi:Tfp pilus assembly protein PilX
MRKAAALLIVILFIAIFGAVGVTIARTGLLNGIFTNNAIDAMIAEEASQAGLEIGLLYFKTNTVPATEKTFCVDLETASVVTPAGTCNHPVTSRFAYVTVGPVTGNPNFVTITSTGYYANTVKKHTLKQQVAAW